MEDWEFHKGVVGWANPPPGCEAPSQRKFALYRGDAADVKVWIENGAVQLLDEMDYYPGGCYSVPLEVIRRLMEEP